MNLDEQTDVDLSKMTKAERIEATWKLPALSPELFNLLQNEGFLTGSSILNGIENINIDPNDFDWCISVPPHVFKHHALGANNQGYWEQDGFSSLYAHYQGELINILCFSDTQLMDSWYMTTQMMSLIAKCQIKRDFYSRHSSMSTNHIGRVLDTKWKRVRLFRALKDIMYDARQLNEPLDIGEALKYGKCRLCGQEAINFTCKEAKMSYQQTGICERCK